MLQPRTVFEQARRSLTIAGKDLRIYYSKGPVVIFGILLPVFLFLAFSVGRELSVEFMIPGLLAMILFFTATAISPIVIPWEAQARTLERLMSSPVTVGTIVMGSIMASFAFGLVISLVPLAIGLALGIQIQNLFVLIAAVLLAAFCFACLGNIFSILPTNLPATVNMISSVVKFPLVFISGIFIPLVDLPAWGQVIAYFSPLTYLADAARYCIEGRSRFDPVLDLLALAAFAALFLVVAVASHRRTMPRRV